MSTMAHEKVLKPLPDSTLSLGLDTAESATSLLSNDSGFFCDQEVVPPASKTHLNFKTQIKLTHRITS